MSASAIPAAGGTLAAHSHPTWADFGPTVWVAIVVAGAFAIWTIWKAVMYTLRPGEQELDHIKRQILMDPSEAAAPGSTVHDLASRPATGATADEVHD